MKLHVLTSEGINEFRIYLQSVRSGEIDDIDREYLLSETNSKKFGIDIDLPEINTNSKKGFIVELCDTLKPIDINKELYNVGLWSWLSVYYFDLVCPFKDGKKKPGADERHILSRDNWRRYYRHLIAAPIRLYIELGDLAIGYMDGSPDIHGEFFEQLASSQEIATSPGIVMAANILFWDFDKQGFKRGTRGKNKPGTIRRFARHIIPQFQMTYDLNSMNGGDIVRILPTEFDIWL